MADKRMMVIGNSQSYYDEVREVMKRLVNALHRQYDARADEDVQPEVWARFAALVGELCDTIGVKRDFGDDNMFLWDVDGLFCEEGYISFVVPHVRGIIEEMYVMWELVDPNCYSYPSGVDGVAVDETRTFGDAMRKLEGALLG